MINKWTNEVIDIRSHGKRALSIKNDRKKRESVEEVEDRSEVMQSRSKAWRGVAQRYALRLTVDM